MKNFNLFLTLHYDFDTISKYITIGILISLLIITVSGITLILLNSINKAVKQAIKWAAAGIAF